MDGRESRKKVYERKLNTNTWSFILLQTFLSYYVHLYDYGRIVEGILIEHI